MILHWLPQILDKTCISRTPKEINNPDKNIIKWKPYEDSHRPSNWSDQSNEIVNQIFLSHHNFVRWRISKYQLEKTWFFRPKVFKINPSFVLFNSASFQTLLSGQTIKNLMKSWPCITNILGFRITCWNFW